MDGDSALGKQNWGGYFFPPPMRGNLGLQLMSSVAERDAKTFFSGTGGGGGCSRGGRGFFHRECGVLEPSTMSVDFGRDVWYHNNRDGGKMLHVFQGNHQQLSQHYGTLLPETSAVPAAFQMVEQVETPMEEKVPVIEENVPVKKRSKGQGRPSKASKPKRTKKANATKEEFGSSNSSGKARSVKKMDMVINGIDLDLSGMPTPVCTCTGQAQQCYRWGAGGWQSACCTTTISMYPLPVSTKRRGTRIAGRKMSHGAFKKVLEKLAGEGQDFSSPIDLKSFWAKHGTNKFVTIR